MTEKQQTIITKNTRLTIGVALAIFGGIVYQLNQQTNTTLAIREVQRDIMEMRQDLISAASDRWRATDMRSWVELLRARNPNLDVPDVGPIR